MDIVRKLTMAVEEDAKAAGYYCVAVYIEGETGRMPGTSYYRHLSWTEAVDVMLVTFDQNRPGDKGSNEVWQRGLW